MLAALPIVTILLLMMGLRWSAARAGGVGLMLALLLAWAVYGLGTQRFPEIGLFGAIGGAMAEALFLAAIILWIIFPALCIHELQVKKGGMDILKQAMERIAGDARILALLVAWFFVLFIEGAAGFGTPMALAAPFLVSAGFSRVAAVSMALIGHMVGSSFGAVGTPTIPQIAASSLSAQEVALANANYHVLVSWMLPLVVMWLAARSMPGGPGKPLWGWAALAVVCFFLPYYLLARFVGPELPTLAGALLGGLLFIVMLRWVRRQETPPGEAPAELPSLLRAASPYLVLIALVVLTRLLPPVQEVLRTFSISWHYAEFSGSVPILYHPGTLLMLSFLCAAWLQKAPLRESLDAVASVSRRLLPVSLALIAMLSLSRVMVHAGMIDALALAAADAAGSAWPLFAPAIGVLGSLVTGSATASNILFGGFQVATAQQLGFSISGMIGAQGYGAVVGNLISPHNIVAASSTVHLVGREGEVLRQTAGITLIYAVLGGLLAWLIFA